MLKRIKKILIFWGFSPRIFVYNIIGIPGYLMDFLKFRKQSIILSEIKLGKFYPALGDKNMPGGSLTNHYFYQDLIIAQRIFKNNPEKHVDIGSRVDGFVANVASFREIEIFDIRPIDRIIPNVKFLMADLMAENPSLYEYSDSVSSLHAIEHFGLGRYGDQIDPEGHKKGLNAIYKTLKPGGKFYFSSPIGPLRVEFNAHRVFSISYLLQLFEGKYKIDRFSYINDGKNLHLNVLLDADKVKSNFDCRFGCGIFELTKI